MVVYRLNVSKVLSNTRESRSLHTFRKWGCRVAQVQTLTTLSFDTWSLDLHTQNSGGRTNEAKRSLSAPSWVGFRLQPLPAA